MPVNGGVKISRESACAVTNPQDGSSKSSARARTFPEESETVMYVSAGDPSLRAKVSKTIFSPCAASKRYESREPAASNLPSAAPGGASGTDGKISADFPDSFADSDGESFGFSGEDFILKSQAAGNPKSGTKSPSLSGAEIFIFPDGRFGPPISNSAAVSERAPSGKTYSTNGPAEIDIL